MHRDGDADGLVECFAPWFDLQRFDEMNITRRPTNQGPFIEPRLFTEDVYVH
jgi:hypothetical protein